MSDESRERFKAAAARAREAMLKGALFDDVLRTFRDDDKFGPIEAILALQELAPIGLSCAKGIVSTWCEGQSYAHLTLADLELLCETPPDGRVDYFMQRSREHAIIDHAPYLLYVRKTPNTPARHFYTSAPPLAPSLLRPRFDSMDEAFESVCHDVRKAAAAWPSELRIIREEPDQLLLHFIRVPAHC
jgi:hypothetical protein